MESRGYNSDLAPKGGIIAWFARNGVAANLLMIGIILTGIMSALSIKKEQFPEFSLDTVVVEVAYLGAAPQEVENGVIIKIEEAVQDLEGVDEIVSNAWEGFGRVAIEVATGYDPQELLDKVKLRVDAISTFPENTENPVIYEQVIENEVIWVQVAGKTDERTLFEYTKQVRDEITELPGITRADVVGARDYEISIEVSEQDLREYGLTFSDVVAAVQQSSIDLPAGSIKTAGGEILLRTNAQAYVGSEFEDIVLISRDDGTRLHLKDIATVIDGFEDEQSFFYYNGEPSLGVRVMRVGDQSSLDVAATVKEYVKQKQSDVPEGLTVAYWGDWSRLLKGRLNLMIKNMLIGGALVFLSLSLFLRLGVGFWVMMGLPVCFLGTLMLMPLDPFDVSINVITLFGFILVLGIVVDDAIVIGESVFTTMQRDGPGEDNVIRGAQEVAMPATFGVLTTIVAFTPMLMIPGTNGKIWSGIAIVVILCLFFSLIESKLILPAHLKHVSVHKDRSKMNGLQRLQRAIADRLERFVQRRYRPVLGLAVRYRYVTTAIFVSTLILTVGLIGGGLVRWVFFPEIESDFVRARLAMAEGTPFDATRRAADQVEAALFAVDQDERDDSGMGLVDNAISWDGGETVANFFVELTPGEERPGIGSVEFVNRWREKVGQIAGATELEFDGTTGDSGAPINFQLVGENVEQLDAAATEIKEKLAEYAGVYDIKDSFATGKQELRLDIFASAEALGIGLADLGNQVRQAFYGAEAQRIQRGKDEVKVMVRYPADERRSLGDLENMRIRTQQGEEVPFASVADAELGRGYSGIRRVDRKRVVNVTADVDKSLIEPDTVRSDIRDNVLPNILAKYPQVGYTIEGEGREQQESMDALLTGLLLAALGIYALMAIPLKSYLKPLIIMSVIPFGIIGAIWGHLLLGLDVSILSVCGIIALSGVVVNDSLVMVDFITRYEKRYDSLFDAVLAAGPIRFRAILLTSLTTFVGLLPMIFETSLQAQFLIPMAASLAFGILFATVITLFLVPSLYIILEDHKRAFAVLGRWLSKPAFGKPRPLADQPAPGGGGGGG